MLGEASDGMDDDIGMEEAVDTVPVVDAEGCAECVCRSVALGEVGRGGDGAGAKGRKVEEEEEVDSSERSEWRGRVEERGWALKRGRREKVRECITGAVVEASSEEESEGEAELGLLREGRSGSGSSSGTRCGRTRSLSKETLGRRGLVVRWLALPGDERWI